MGDLFFSVKLFPHRSVTIYHDLSEHMLILNLSKVLNSFLLQGHHRQCHTHRETSSHTQKTCYTSSNPRMYIISSWLMKATDLNKHWRCADFQTLEVC